MKKIEYEGRIRTLMTIREAAATGVASEYHLRQLDKEGLLPGYTVGNKKIVFFEELLAVLGLA